MSDFEKYQLDDVTDDLWDKIYNNTLTLDDQQAALNSPTGSYEFIIKKIPGSDFAELIEMACNDPEYACYIPQYISDVNIEYCQESACRIPEWAYYFAKDVPGANIEYCQKAACKSPHLAYHFALEVPGADIEYCRKACESNEYYLKEFDKMIAEKVLV